MRRVHGSGGKFKTITFTVKIRCSKGMDVTEELDKASVDLSDDNLNFKLKSIKCARNAKELMAVMT